jgi:hypothetical protein
MKVRTIIGIAVAAVWLTSTAVADKYDDLVTKGYRWVNTDGPFACTSKDAVQRLIKDQSDENTLRMVQQGGVYYLIRGVIVQVVQEDKASGMSQFHWDGIAASRFLSKRPITNVLGTITIPGQHIGDISGINSQLSATTTPSTTATPGATATPTHGEAAEPNASPTP